MTSERFVVCCDNHGAHRHRPTVDAFLAFVKDYKPKVRIHAGDNWSFDWLRKGASTGEREGDTRDDFQHGLWFYEKYQPHVFLWGNHDARLQDVLDDPRATGERLAYAELLKEKIVAASPKTLHKIYQKRAGAWRWGDHTFLHGYAHGVGGLRKQAMVYGNVIVGHIHRQETVPTERIDGAIGHACGCLCELEQPYNRSHLGTLMQRHGWIYGEKTKGGKLIVHHARFIDGAWRCPT